MKNRLAEDQAQNKETITLSTSVATGDERQTQKEDCNEPRKINCKLHRGKPVTQPLRRKHVVHRNENEHDLSDESSDYETESQELENFGASNCTVSDRMRSEPVNESKEHNVQHASFSKSTRKSGYGSDDTVSHAVSNPPYNVYGERDTDSSCLPSPSISEGTKQNCDVRNLQVVADQQPDQLQISSNLTNCLQTPDRFCHQDSLQNRVAGDQVQNEHRAQTLTPKVTVTHVQSKADDGEPTKKEDLDISRKNSSKRQRKKSLMAPSRKRPAVQQNLDEEHASVCSLEEQLQPRGLENATPMESIMSTQIIICYQCNMQNRVAGDVGQNEPARLTQTSMVMEKGEQPKREKPTSRLQHENTLLKPVITHPSNQQNTVADESPDTSFEDALGPLEWCASNTSTTLDSTHMDSGPCDNLQHAPLQQHNSARHNVSDNDIIRRDVSICICLSNETCDNKNGGENDSVSLLKPFTVTETLNNCEDVNQVPNQESQNEPSSSSDTPCLQKPNSSCYQYNMQSRLAEDQSQCGMAHSTQMAIDTANKAEDFNESRKSKCKLRRGNRLSKPRWKTLAVQQNASEDSSDDSLPDDLHSSQLENSTKRKNVATNAMKSEQLNGQERHKLQRECRMPHSTPMAINNARQAKGEDFYESRRKVCGLRRIKHVSKSCRKRPTVQQNANKDSSDDSFQEDLDLSQNSTKRKSFGINAINPEQLNGRESHKLQRASSPLKTSKIKYTPDHNITHKNVPTSNSLYQPSCNGNSDRDDNSMLLPKPFTCSENKEKSKNKIQKTDQELPSMSSGSNIPGSHCKQCQNSICYQYNMQNRVAGDVGQNEPAMLTQTSMVMEKGEHPKREKPTSRLEHENTLLKPVITHPSNQQNTVADESSDTSFEDVLGPLEWCVSNTSTTVDSTQMDSGPYDNLQHAPLQEHNSTPHSVSDNDSTKKDVAICVSLSNDTCKSNSERETDSLKPFTATESQHNCEGRNQGLRKNTCKLRRGKPVSNPGRKRQAVRQNSNDNLSDDSVQDDLDSYQLENSTKRKDVATNTLKSEQLNGQESHKLQRESSPQKTRKINTTSDHNITHKNVPQFSSMCQPSCYGNNDRNGDSLLLPKPFPSSENKEKRRDTNKVPNVLPSMLSRSCISTTNRKQWPNSICQQYDMQNRVTGDVGQNEHAMLTQTSMVIDNGEETGEQHKRENLTSKLHIQQENSLLKPAITHPSNQQNAEADDPSETSFKDELGSQKLCNSNASTSVDSTEMDSVPCDTLQQHNSRSHSVSNNDSTMKDVSISISLSNDTCNRNNEREGDSFSVLKPFTASETQHDREERYQVPKQESQTQPSSCSDRLCLPKPNSFCYQYSMQTRLAEDQSQCGMAQSTPMENNNGKQAKTEDSHESRKSKCKLRRGKRVSKPCRKTPAVQQNASEDSSDDSVQNDLNSEDDVPNQ
ncbi:serine-rich adhesin for platelets-like [Ptychodera flava]|uniref:serine-rich adhesin for platelets-like n=1 Tax=Ptychodera flava TaxID=63121 RepID=UPI00396A0939